MQLSKPGGSGESCDFLKELQTEGNKSHLEFVSSMKWEVALTFRDGILFVSHGKVLSWSRKPDSCRPFRVLRALTQALLRENSFQISLTTWHFSKQNATSCMLVWWAPTPWHISLVYSDAFLPVGHIQKSCQENGQRYRKGNSQLVHSLTFYWTSPYGFEITKYLQTGEIKLDIILPVPIAATTEIIQAFFIFFWCIHFLKDKQGQRLFICWINYRHSFTLVYELSLN